MSENGTGSDDTMAALEHSSYSLAISPDLNPSKECDGCMCPTEHDGDYGSAGHAGPCPPHTCGLATPPGATAEETP